MTSDNSHAAPEKAGKLLRLSKTEIQQRLHQAKVTNALFKRMGTVSADQLEAHIHHLARYHASLQEKTKEWLATLKILRLEQNLSQMNDLQYDVMHCCKERGIEEYWQDREDINDQILKKHIDSLSRSIRTQEKKS
jgi:hypothetical protein